MKITFDNFDELADWMYRKNLAYEELRDENRQLEMKRVEDSDRIAELEEEVFELSRKLHNTLTQPSKKSPAATDDK